MIRRTIPVALLLALLASASLIAQTFRGGISGTVADASGAAVAGAPVKLVSPDTGLTREGVTTSAGEFVFPDLPLGKYDITVTQAGFDTVHVSGIVVDAGKTATVGLKLEVAKQATTIEVAAATVAIETAASAETSIINTQQLLDIPLTGRSTEPTTTTFGTTSTLSTKAACRALPARCFRSMPSPSSRCRAAAAPKRAATRVAR
jgi:hypothetical protein